MATRILVMTAFALAVTASGWAQEKAPNAQTTSSSSDRTFVTKAAQGGMAEVELGKLAVDKASSDEVKKFWQRMVDDHGKANDDLKSLARNKNITWPSDLDAKDKALKDRLSNHCACER